MLSCLLPASGTPVHIEVAAFPFPTAPSLLPLMSLYTQPWLKQYEKARLCSMTQGQQTFVGLVFDG